MNQIKIDVDSGKFMLALKPLARRFPGHSDVMRPGFAAPAPEPFLSEIA